MQTITIEINEKGAMKKLQALEDKHAITIIETADLDSPAFKGKQLSISEFKSWVKNAEEAPTFSLAEVKSKWASKRKQLQKLTR